MIYYVNVRDGRTKSSTTDDCLFIYPRHDTNGWCKVDVNLFSLLMMVYANGYIDGYGETEE